MDKFDQHKPSLFAQTNKEPLSDGMKVGLFGGSFNPAHPGHLHLAKTAKKRLALHRVLWLVSPGNPLKDSNLWNNYDERLQSAQSITDKLPNHFTCESEVIFRTKYSIDTITGLQKRWPKVRFVWLIGADNLSSFHLWRDWQKIAKTIPIAVVARPGDPIRARLSPLARQFSSSRLPEPAARILANQNAPAWIYLTAPLSALSSTAIRAN